MSLPKISLPLYEIKIPSNGKTIKFRPFTVKENRILLLASESQSTEQIVLATKQIISLCVQDDIDVESLPMFDIEFLFWCQKLAYFLFSLSHSLTVFRLL